MSRLRADETKTTVFISFIASRDKEEESMLATQAAAIHDGSTRQFDDSKTSSYVFYEYEMRQFPRMTEEDERTFSLILLENFSKMQEALKQIIRIAGSLPRTNTRDRALVLFRKMHAERRLIPFSDLQNVFLACIDIRKLIHFLPKTSCGKKKLFRNFLDAKKNFMDAYDEFAKARNVFVERNLRLANDVAKEFIGHSVPFADLRQRANMGLMRAAELFDINKGWRFSTFATYWVRQGIWRALAEHGTTVHTPVHIFERRNAIKKERRNLTQRLQRPPTLPELSKHMGVSEEYIQEIEAPYDAISLDRPVLLGNGNQVSLHDMLPDSKNTSSDDEIYQSELKREIEKVLKTLTPREEDIIRTRCGFNDCEQTGLREIAAKHHVSYEWIRLIEAKALDKLRTPEVRNLLLECIARR